MYKGDFLFALFIFQYYNFYMTVNFVWRSLLTYKYFNCNRIGSWLL